MGMKLSDIFAECCEDKYIKKVLGATIESLDSCDNGKRITMHISSREYISREDLHNAEIAVREKYGLSAVRFEPKFPSELFSADVLDDVIIELRRRVATVNGSFTGCKWEYDKDKATVTANLAMDCRPLLRARDFEDKMQQLIKDEFGVLITLILNPVDNLLHIVGAKVGIESCLSCYSFQQLLLCVFATETKPY